MYYISLITGIFFILVGLCFFAVSIRVHSCENKVYFFLGGLFTLLLGAYPLLIPSEDSAVTP